MGISVSTHSSKTFLSASKAILIWCRSNSCISQNFSYVVPELMKLDRHVKCFYSPVAEDHLAESGYCVNNESMSCTEE